MAVLSILLMTAVQALAAVVPTDKASIEAGNKIFEQYCSGCHTTRSTKTIVGPGLKGILKRKTLPVSGRPATPEDIVDQIKNPYRNMPAFRQFSKKQLEDILAYLNTV